ncbi:unnamed protein product [Parnassius apollo]|uniref:(apollo) hypothetical protein n=1 Tax=Parnassius apollo TaxID=110799 RepID=A0A8S3YD27_PARAO|nr:unnamed protein product [Parnassius apollo]
MLRAVSSIYIESQAFAVVRRDVIKLFRTTAYSGITSNQHPRKFKKYKTTVLAGASSSKQEPVPLQSTPSPPAPPSQPPPRGPRRGWFAATAVALTASVGGVYIYRKLNTNKEEQQLQLESKDESGEVEGTPIPASAESLPSHVEYLVVGGGTAAFAALRAIRSVKPEARVLLVSEEIGLPYMRPPLNKELWREPDLATRAADPDTLVFQQWNGKRRRLAYEPNSFYLPTEKLRDGSPGAGVARGWTVTALDVDKHEAKLSASGTTATLTYDKCLIATGARAKRCEALRAARSAGLALPLRSARDVARLAAALQRSHAGSVVVVGGGAHACELAAALAERLRDSDKRVMLVFREAAPLAGELPGYLAAHLARALQALGVHLLPSSEVIDSRVSSEQVHLQLKKVGGEDISPGSEEDSSELVASLVVECLGNEPNTELAVSSGLEVHPDLGGVVVNAEMQARSGVFAAGDAACFHEPLLGRRRVARHDHAVASGRLAGANMAALEPPRPYTHQPMLWADVGPRIGYEAIGIIDSRLPTVGVFSADAVTEARAITNTQEDVETEQAVIEKGNQIPTDTEASSQDASKETGSESSSSGTLVQRSTSSEPSSRSYERGVVFYLRDKRVVGVLLWNLFNRMHIARQVLKQGEFEDMFEVAKLFSLHEED